MSVFFNVRPVKLISKRVITSGDLTITAGGAFAAVPGTQMQINVAKDSITEIKVEGVVLPGLKATADFDLLVDNVRVGAAAANGLLTVGETTLGTVKVYSGFHLDETLDGLAEGVHTIALAAKATTADATLFMDDLSNVLTITVLEHASVYPPSASTP